jgi:hypothetical protein
MTRTAIPVFAVNCGRRCLNRPDASVEVVEATVMKGFSGCSAAFAGTMAAASDRATPSRRGMMALVIR